MKLPKITQNKSLHNSRPHLQSQNINDVTKLPSWISNCLKIIEIVLAQLRKICINYFLEIVYFDKSINQKRSYYSNDESCQATKLI